MTRDWLLGLAGPTAWFVAHVASWMLVPGAHEAGSLTGIYLVDGAALVISVVACVAALARLRALGRVPPAAPGLGRARFVVGSAVALAALSVLLVVGLTLPMFLLVPGAEP